MEIPATSRCLVVDAVDRVPAPNPAPCTLRGLELNLCTHYGLSFPALYAVGGAYTQKPVYTRGGTYTHPLCLRTTARVNAPTRVYAPDAAFTRGRDERHVTNYQV
jgi:hypothetical protein